MRKSFSSFFSSHFLHARNKGKNRFHFHSQFYFTFYQQNESTYEISHDWFIYQMHGFTMFFCLDLNICYNNVNFQAYMLIFIKTATFMILTLFYMNCILLLVMKINIFKQYLFIREKIEQRVESPLNIHTVSKVER